jgi:hypothetical protein
MYFEMQHTIIKKKTCNLYLLAKKQEIPLNTFQCSVVYEVSNEKVKQRLNNKSIIFNTRNKFGQKHYTQIHEFNVQL